MLDQRLAGWLALVLGVPLVLLVGAWWLRRRPRKSLESDEDRLDTVGGWPPTVTRLLTPVERTAFSILRTALPDYVVLSQVPLARFIDVSKRNSYTEWLRRVGSQSIDFLICDSNSQVVAVVDLQAPAAQAPPRAVKRQARIARTLRAAKVPLHVWTSSALPSAEVARDDILRPPNEPLPPPVPARRAEIPIASGPLSPADSTTPGLALSSVAGPGSARARNPFEETGRDSSQDEFIEAQEPPPSTWYDDFDSGPTPLGSDKRPRR